MNLTRRDLLKTAAAAAASPLAASTAAAFPKGSADACIFLWLGGGAAHIDTFDPKRCGDGKKMPGSYYGAISTAIRGEQVCEHLKRTAPLLDRCVIVRSLTHKISGEHAAAANLVHTGRLPSGTIQYPSIGSVVSPSSGRSRTKCPPT